MSNKKNFKTLSIAAGTAFVASLAISPVANAAEGVNPFSMNELSGGYMQLAEAGHGHDDHKKMEGSCGGKNKMSKEAKCGGAMGMKDNKMKKEGKCGEGKCGGKKKMEKMKKEGSCGGKKDMGEGKCGGKK